MMTTDGGSHGRHGGTATYLLPPQAATGTGCEPDSDSPSVTVPLSLRLPVSALAVAVHGVSRLEVPLRRKFGFTVPQFLGAEESWSIPDRFGPRG